MLRSRGLHPRGRMTVFSSSAGLVKRTNGCSSRTKRRQNGAERTPWSPKERGSKTAMPRPPIDFPQKIRDILAHVSALPAEAGAPLAHFNRSSTDLWNLLLYVERNFEQLVLQPAALRRHMARLHGMILVNLIETFERFLKEVAAAC